MAESNPSQAQHAEVWKKLVDEQLARTTALLEETAKLEVAGAEQAQRAIDEGAKLARESLAYAGKLGAEWRRLGLEAFKQAASLWLPRA